MRSLALIAGLGLVLQSAPALAKSKRLTIRVGSVAPQGTPWAIWLKQIARRIGKNSKAQGLNIRIKPALGGKLGGEKRPRQY